MKEVIFLILIWVTATFVPDRPLGMVSCDYPLYPLSVCGGIAGTIVIYYVLKKIEAKGWFYKLFRLLCWVGECSLVILCLHLIDLDLPIRANLGINKAIYAIVFDLTFCIVGVILISWIPFLRNIFKIKKVCLNYR